MNSKFEIFRELFIEFLIIFLILGNLSEHLEALLDDILSHDLEDLVLLESLTRDVERQVLRVDNSLNEREPVWDNFLAIIHDENSTDVQLDVVFLLFGLEEIEGSSLRNEEESTEFKGTFDIEVLEGKVRLPIIAESLVEVLVLFRGDVFWLAHPDGLNLVEGLHLVGDFLDLLGLLLFLFFVLDLLDLGFFFLTFLLFFSVFLLLLLFWLIIGVCHFLFGGFLDLKFDWECDKLGVLFDEVLESAFFEILLHIVLKLEDDLGTSTHRLTIIWNNSESTTGIGLPSVLLTIVVLGHDSHFLSDEIRGVETHTELTNHANIGTSGDGFHESTGSGLGNCSEIVDEIRLLHTNTSILDGQRVVGAIWNDLNFEIWLSLELFWLNNSLVSDFVESVGTVGDELSQEDLLVGVESVDDKRHQLLDVSIECKYFFTHGTENLVVFFIQNVL